MLERAANEAQLAWDRVVYGSSFELDGERVDPRRVLLRGDGTYELLPTPDGEAAP